MKKVIVNIALLGMVLFIYKGYQKVVPVSATSERPIAIVTLNDGTVFKMELYPEYAPNTVANFIKLVESDFYQNTFLNRRIPGYLVQMGDPIGNGYGFPGYVIKSECKYNGVDNPLKHTRGTISMARAQAFNTEGSQFFILLTDDFSLNGQYSAFARVVEGLDDLETISYNEDNKQMPFIETIEIEKMEAGITEPEVIPAFKEKIQTEIQ